jgi:hypothetical protein
MNELSAKEKARAGLWMLRQAVLQLLREQGPMQPSEVRDSLGLRHDESQAPGVAMGVMTLMFDTGELVKDEGTHPKYSVTDQR